MAKNQILIKFRIGKNSGSKDATGSGAAQAITDAVANLTGNLAKDRVKVNLRSLNSRLLKTIETEYALGVKYAADNMMGQISDGARDKVFGFNNTGFNTDIPRFKSFSAKTANFTTGSVVWAPLSRNTVRRKIADGLSIDRARRYYRHTGALRAELLSKAREMVKRTGIVRITFNDTGRFTPVKDRKAVIPVGRLRITLLPKTPRSALPGLITGDLGDVNKTMAFERSLGLSDDAIMKLRGPMSRGYNLANRPLLQPVFTYWSLFRIPNRIAAALDATIHNATVGNDAGEEFGVGN